MTCVPNMARLKVSGGRACRRCGPVGSAPMLKTGKPIAASSLLSRCRPQMTKPARPAARPSSRTISPMQASSCRPPLSMTTTSPARTLSNASRNTSMLPACRTVRAGPRHSMPGCSGRTVGGAKRIGTPARRQPSARWGVVNCARSSSIEFICRPHDHAARLLRSVGFRPLTTFLTFEYQIVLKSNFNVIEDDDLRYRCLADYRGRRISRASRALRSSSAARNPRSALKKLEEQAGRPLFLRKGRGLVPTEAGEQLLAYARAFCRCMTTRQPRSPSDQHAADQWPRQADLPGDRHHPRRDLAAEIHRGVLSPSSLRGATATKQSMLRRLRCDGLLR